ncbi:MAG: hypothetical protein EXR98_05110 [Gemmataceae bacterium]|nr:hypothetical protein [Gemmataceae bacterium]
MLRILMGAAVAFFGLFVSVNAGCAQEELKTTGFGSVSGKVTLEGALPEIVDLLPKMKIHRDKECCLTSKTTALEKIDTNWIVDPKTKAIANVVVWVKPPAGKYFPIPAKFKKRQDDIVIDQPHCAFLPRVSASNPVYYDGTEFVKTGQKVLVKNSATKPHNIRATGHPLKVANSFNINLPAKTELEKVFAPQPLPILLNCDFHTWMAGKHFVFDHPYYAITNMDGTFEISMVPAGAEIHIVSWHEETGWGFKEGKAGRPITVNAGKNLKVDFQLKVPVEK